MSKFKSLMASLVQDLPPCPKCGRRMRPGPCHVNENRADIFFDCSECQTCVVSGSSYSHCLSSLQASNSDLPAPSRRPSIAAIALGEAGESPVVFGKQKSPLSAAKYEVIKTLLAASPAGLSKNELESRSKKADAVKYLRQIRNIDKDWNAAIIMAGKSWQRYRIAQM